MKLKGILISGLVSGLIIFVVWMIVSMAVQLLAPYDVLKLSGMRDKEDPLMLLFFLYPWVIGFALAVVYSYMGKSLQGTAVHKGQMFGKLMWLVTSLPSAYIVYTSMDYPIAFTATSGVASLIYMPIAGIAIAKLMAK